MTKKKLGELLIDEGALTRAQLTSALKDLQGDDTRLKLGEFLVKRGLAEEQVVYRLLARQLGFEFMALEGNTSLGSAISEVPGWMARELHIFPTIATSSGSIFVATVDPQNIEMLNQLEKHTSKKIQLFVATASEIKVAIEQFYGHENNLSENIDGPPPIPQDGADEALTALAEDVESFDDDFIISMEEEQTPPAHSMVEHEHQDLSDLLEEAFDDDLNMEEEPEIRKSLNVDLRGEKTPPQGYSISDASDEHGEKSLPPEQSTSFEPDFASTTNAEIENIEKELSDLMQDNDELILSFDDTNTPPAGNDVDNMDAELSQLLEEDDDEIELSFDDGGTPPAGNDVDNMDAELSQLLEEDDDEIELSFDDGGTPPAGNDVGNMDAELSQLLEEDDDRIELSFDDVGTPPAGNDVGNMDAELSQLLEEDDDEIELSFDDGGTPPAGNDVGNMDAELSQLLEEDEDEIGLSFVDDDSPPAGNDGNNMDAELSQLLDDVSEDEILDGTEGGDKDEELLALFDDVDDDQPRDTVVDYELGFDPQNTPPAGLSVGNMDDELADLFSDEEEIVEDAGVGTDLGVEAVHSDEAIDQAQTEPNIDANLPFHVVPWGLLLARKNGLDTEEIRSRTIIAED